MTTAVRRGRPTIAAALAGALALAGCGRVGPRESLDLAELFAHSRHGSETARIDFGSQASQAHLVSGWGPRAESGSREFQWGMGPRSELRFDVGEPRDLEIALRGWPLAFDGAPPQTVAVAVNARPVATLALEPRPHAYRVRIPGDALVPGENRLSLDYAWARALSEVVPGARERRPLAVAWQWLRVRDAQRHGAPARESASGPPALRLPLDAWIEYALRVRDGGWLRFEAIESYGAPESAHLELAIEPRGGPVVRARLDPGRDLALRLPDTRGDPLRIALRAVGRAAPDAEAGLRLVAPTLDLPAASAPVASAPVPAARPNVVVYLVDTLRADHLGAYGSARPTSPHLDAFARDATVFRNAFAQSSWTRPAVASLFTGLLPQSHRVLAGAAAIPDSLPLLPALLREHGYATLGVVTNGNVARPFGFARGFDVFEQLREGRTPDIHQLSDRANAAAFRALDQRPSDRPFFLYVHTTDPHWPYTPREPYRTRLAPDVADPALGRADPSAEPAPTPVFRRDLGELYDAEIAFNDDSFGSLLEKLRELGAYADSLIVFLSDHGEAFHDHGTFGHGTTLFEEEIRIPLVIRFPDGLGAGRVVDAPARQIDVLPTILDCVGAPAPPGLPGRSLRPLAAGDGDAGGGTTFAYLDRRGRVVETAIEDGHKLIRFRVEGRGAPSLGLFDLARDPHETRDLSEVEPIWRDYLLSRLSAAAVAPPGPEPASAPIDDEQRRALEALGYVDE